MANILPVMLHPHPALTRQATPVANVDDAVRTTLANMLETLRCANGIGLAAPQVNISQRLVVIEPAADDEPDAVMSTPDNKPLLMVNPRIVARSDETIDSEEGCLSIPRVFDTIERSAWVKVAYLDSHGNPQTVEGEGLLGRCLQHEIDHLDGILFIDHLSRLKRDLLLKKYRKIMPEFLQDNLYPTERV